jgi:pre-rRNA-processing protein TSR1
VADYVVFILSPTVEVDTWGDTLLRALQAQGLPEVVSVMSADASIDAKSRSGIIKSLLSFMQYFVPSQTRVFDMHSSSDRINALRALSEGKPEDPRWRDGRTWVLGEAAEWEDGTLRVTGVVRGVPLSANRLVHLPNFGDYQISKVRGPLPTSTSGDFVDATTRFSLLLYLAIMEKRMEWTSRRRYLQNLMKMRLIP